MDQEKIFIMKLFFGMNKHIVGYLYCLKKIKSMVENQRTINFAKVVKEKKTSKFLKVRVIMQLKEAMNLKKRDDNLELGDKIRFLFDDQHYEDYVQHCFDNKSIFFFYRVEKKSELEICFIFQSEFLCSDEDEDVIINRVYGDILNNFM